ncbi:tetratricopeptide repeat protein [Propionispora hippei]|uniref:Tetratricopeptide repeat-containing protein n=1 Tax=Propionispora hippei DSM 15287 TaxID=1123003 RepID=A0A1M6G836_9FIRM|nr:tetratricopeptide repeat protein [Propionispora hippei]SHJ06092.1 Tetratricopeptide repeat-containing protein [Propionispora hippei DSM 15287]
MRIKQVLALLTLVFFLGSAVCYTSVMAKEEPLPDTLGQSTEMSYQNRDAAREYAVTLARGGEYRPALAILENLMVDHETEADIVFDYTVVAVWAGEYTKAVQLYEERIKSFPAVPDYVRINVAQAYFKTGHFNDAWQLYHQSAMTGNRKARLWEAESLVHTGSFDEAERIYSILLEEQPDNLAAYSGKANILLARGDADGAAKLIETALASVDGWNDPALKASLLTLRGEMAAQFIRHDAYRQAIVLLRPTIRDKSATVQMQCDYVLALFLYGDYTTAVKEGTQLWPNYREIPAYGRRALADSYLRLYLPQQAIGIYCSILEQGESLPSDRHSLAYAYMLTGSKEKQAMVLYRELINMAAEQAMVITGDADSFFAMGRYEAGKKLYQAIIHTYPDYAAFRQQFAAVLYRQGLIREAYEQYLSLAALPGTQPAANSGIVNTAVPGGDYYSARQAVTGLDRYSANPMTAQALRTFEERWQGSLAVNATGSRDYKGNKDHRLQLTGEQRVTDRVDILAGIGSTWISDGQGETVLRTNSVGGRYTDMKHMVQLWLDQGRTHGRLDGYHLTTSRYFGEQSRVDFSINRTPVMDAEALPSHMMATEYQLAYNRQIGLKDNLSVMMAAANYSDRNRRHDINLDWDHVMVDTGAKQLSWFGYADRTGFKKQMIDGVEPVYESPRCREAYGLGLRQRWNFTKHYWETSFEIGVGRDRPEPMDTSTSLRTEYGYHISRNQALTVSVEYGLRTGYSTGTGGKPQFSDRQYNVSYQLSW